MECFQEISSFRNRHSLFQAYMDSSVKYKNFRRSKQDDGFWGGTSPGALEPNKSSPSLRRYELFKGLGVFCALLPCPINGHWFLVQNTFEKDSLSKTMDFGRKLKCYLLSELLLLLSLLLQYLKLFHAWQQMMIVSCEWYHKKIPGTCI